MSDPLTNLEIQDVLSSIRRLVSEDNRHRAERDRQRQEAEAAQRGSEAGAKAESLAGAETDTGGASLPSAAEPGKLVLTEALRVAAGTDTVSALSLDETVTGEGRFAADHVLPAIAEAEAAGGSTWEDAGADAAEDGGSLEGTIAELEAAVAGIGGEFEPDGSEVAKGTAVDAELEEAFEEGFPVDFAAEEEIATLAQPVTAGPAVPVPVTSQEPGPNADAVAAAWQPEQAAGDGVAMPEAAAEAVDEIEPQPVAPVDHFDLNDAIPDEAAAAAIPAFVHSAAARLRADPAPAEDRPRPVIHRRLTLTAAEAVTEGHAPWDRGHAGGGAVESGGSAPSGTAPGGEPPGLASAIADEAMAGSGDEAADETSIFGPGDDGLIDMDMLRDLVAEIIREELQGALGERITRNVRMLVRREINRALEARGLE